MSERDLPYQVEYAKSSRSSCRACKKIIGKDYLRMGIMVQSPHFDGKVPIWHHMHCFYKKKTLQAVSDIANFNNLRYEDQKKIKEHLAGKTVAASSKDKNMEYSVEYSKSSRSTCKICDEKILKGLVRISKLDSESLDALRFGPLPRWHHVDCFAKVRQELEYTDSADKLPGFKSLADEDQKMLSSKIKGLGVKRKAEPTLSSSHAKVPKTSNKEEKALQKQSKLFFTMRDNLKRNLSKKELVELLEINNQHISTGESNLLDHLTDSLIFGALEPCQECKTGKPRFKNDFYRCSGHLTEWTNCEFVTKTPERKPFVVPEEFRESYHFLSDYKYEKRERLFVKTLDPSSPQKSKSLPLTDFKIALLTTSKKTKEKLQQLGATVSYTVTKITSFVIASEAQYKKGGTKITKAKTNDIHVVSESFVEAIQKGNSPSIAMKENMLSSWGGDPILKFGIKKEKSESSFKYKASTSDDKFVMKSSPKTVKVTVSGSAAVDPASGLQEKAHVLERGGCVYNAVLGRVDISKGINSFYKLQVLESNTGKRYWVFRAWGRIGTTIGGDKSDGVNTVDSAIDLFEELYFEKTGNVWENRKNFVKQPGLSYPLDIDYGQDQIEKHKELKPGSSSLLSTAVQELICFIFDIEAMKKAMVEFEIDLRKMPLGKLSKSQIQKAYSVLTEAQQVLLSGGNTTRTLDASNRFYTLIPHDFGMKKPPLLDNEEIIKSKIEMIDSLLEIEFAYNLLKSDGSSMKDPVDEHYEKLKTDIEVLDRSSCEYKHIETYLNNTHAKTHSSYKLKIEEVYKINRHGESERYQKFKDLHNKKLLWHGSRFTNFVGILSNGLRIAPPEAPSTGYMFGKGIYFADMVSKSANYCFASRQNSIGILLLCEVALGNMYERTNADFIHKLPKDKHSTFGVGCTTPNPKETIVENSVEIPLGKAIPALRKEQLSLLYNEYIVYDINQVNIKYLLKVDFKWR